jgi:hypothetical protein
MNFARPDLSLTTMNRAYKMNFDFKRLLLGQKGFPMNRVRKEKLFHEPDFL